MMKNNDTSFNMYISAIGALDSLFIRRSYTQSKFLKKEQSQLKKSVLFLGLFCTVADWDIMDRVITQTRSRDC